MCKYGGNPEKSWCVCFETIQWIDEDDIYIYIYECMYIWWKLREKLGVEVCGLKSYIGLMMLMIYIYVYV